MAAPKDSPEQAFRLRKFQGTNTQIDSTFLGPSFVARSENWIPTQSYRIGVRPGHRSLQSLGNATVTALLAAHDPNGVPYLYAYCLTPSAAAQVRQLQDEGAPSTNPPNATFPDHTARGGMVCFRDRIYAGNGKDPLMSWKIGDAGANTLTFAPITNLGAPAAPTVTDATAGSAADRQVPTGTYSFAWGAYDTVKLIYTGRTDPATIAVASGKVVAFTAPSVALPTNSVYRLFVSPRNFPIEYATMQADSLAASAVTNTFSSFDVSDTRVPMAGGINVFRTGNMFLVWRNRVVFAGMQATATVPDAPYRVYATDVILPGLEQAAFNQGTLFPDFAQVPLPQTVTGLGIAGVTSDYDATSPLLFFTSSRTFMVQGDPFDPNPDVPATLVELSSRVGCISHCSIVNTPYGTIWCGIDSIYLVPPGGGYPQDVGWPIADQIRQIPVGVRSQVCATFHKQFYKIAMPAAAGSTLTTQWWLDLRQGVTDAPSWWGPHTGVTVSAMASDPDSTREVDRGYVAAVAPTGPTTTEIFACHQLGIYQETIPGQTTPIPIRSFLRSGRFDADQPFIPKVFTRLRLICQATAKSALHVTLFADAGKATVFDPVIIGEGMEDPGRFVHLHAGADGEPPPPNKCWNTAHFGSITPVEVQTIAPYTRPRALSVVVNVTHDPAQDASDNDPTTLKSMANVELRDFELLFIFSERKVRFLGERVS